MRTRIAALAVLLLPALASASAIPTVSFTGNFVYDNDVVLFDVFVQTPAQLTVYTSSYASGGFQTHLEMFDATGTTQFAVSNGGVPACVPIGPAPVRGGIFCGDAEVHEGPTLLDVLPAGHYLVALSQADNYSDGFDIRAPFTHDGVDGRNYTAVPGVCDAYFCDSFFMTPDTSDWAVTFQFDNATGSAAGTVEQLGSVPEPASVLLAAGGIALIVLRKNRGGLTPR